MPRHSARLFGTRLFAAIGVAGLAMSLPASAQVADLTFERWCLENQGWDEARCNARSEADLAEFKLYRDQVERYEAEFRRKQEADRILRERVDTQGNTNPDTSREVGE